MDFERLSRRLAYSRVFYSREKKGNNKNIYYMPALYEFYYVFSGMKFNLIFIMILK